MENLFRVAGIVIAIVLTAGFYVWMTKDIQKEVVEKLHQDDFSVICMDGVQYWYKERASYKLGYGHMAVKFTKEGTVALCE